MWPRICATDELKLEEITAASWHRVGDHNTAIRQPYLLPLRLPETAVRIGDDAGCEGLGNSFAEMRQTFPKRWLARSTGVRSASTCWAQLIKSDRAVLTFGRDLRWENRQVRSRLKRLPGSAACNILREPDFTNCPVKTD